ncbi:hypothetical protein BE20_25945 [Sorangium cellulosum]|uniref:PEGA domain-containing protein n=1 Tax=Sorangium cellulosum TaxID=56 RepID=A0A150S4U2_SORCE|nr:hypothetical protein BE18_07010 [Sorangium cellulosum]KYF87485.1 hypothetical protein BE20_25945 [Sorangium cellulosum]
MAEAQALFDEALALMKNGKYTDACPMLKKSHELDPGMGTQYRLAECYESVGLTGSAWSIFLEVAESARAAGRSDREARAKERAEALKPKVPMLLLTVPAEIANLVGLRVERDGADVDPSTWNVPAAIDPGEHTIRVTAPGKKAWEQTAQVLAGATLEVRVPVLKNDAGVASAAAAPAPRPAPAPAGAGMNGFHLGAIAAGSVGLVGIGLGAGFGFKTLSQWDAALSHCKDLDKSRCDDEGIALGEDARTSAAMSTAGFVVGGVGIATAAILLNLAPKSGPAANGKAGLQVTPVIGQNGMEAVLRGNF